jgi:hypothetical protein
MRGARFAAPIGADWVVQIELADGSGRVQMSCRPYRGWACQTVADVLHRRQHSAQLSHVRRILSDVADTPADSPELPATPSKIPVLSQVTRCAHLRVCCSWQGVGNLCRV